MPPVAATVDGGALAALPDGGPQRHWQAHLPETIPVCDALGLAPQDAARQHAEAGAFDKALACAVQSSALAPNDPDAHVERGRMLAALGRLDEARLAFARALALDADHLEGLFGAALLYGLQLPASFDHDALALVYAEHGFELAQAQKAGDLAQDFARLDAQILNNVGDATQALARAEWLLAHAPLDEEGRFEKALALFELCRFSEARTVFATLTSVQNHSAWAHYYLSLLEERAGHDALADQHLASARRLSPEDFPVAVEFNAEAFNAALKRLVAELPADMRADLKGIPIQAMEFPAEADLTHNTPPLSPTILGMFKGPMLGESCLPEDGTPCRSITLFRRNLLRAVRTPEELITQMQVTLVHEIGHLRGEGDDELTARGLQ